MAAALGVERSFLGQRWTLSDANPEIVQRLTGAHGMSEILARLLAGRGVDAADADGYLAPSLRSLLPEPFLLHDMEKAVARTHRAIASGEQIAVFGDYDVDGSCSAAILSEFLTMIGRSPLVYIPDRMTEGYGPSARALLQLKARGAGLVITVDCGATADAALGAARDAGLDVIVLDHHALDRANAHPYAQVNPNQPEDSSALGHLCAAGVVFLFMVALNRSLRDAGWYRDSGLDAPDLMASVDLVGLATICDVVPLTGVNRAFVRAAMARLSARPRTGLRALAALAKVNAPYTPYHFGFVFGPRINAGGRVGCCSLGVELLTAADHGAADALAGRLERHNRERKSIEGLILEDAQAQASTQDNASFVLVAGEGWHAGVIGIVAGRLKDRFAKPAFAVGFEGGLGRGSARSIPGVDAGALVRSARENGLLETGGGHAMAAGFSIAERNLDAFREFLTGHVSAAATSASRELVLEGLVSPFAATASLVEELQRAGPFGAGNPEPVFAAPGLRLAYADTVGREHIRLRLEGAGGARLDAIAFRAARGALGEGLLKSRGRQLHVAGHLKADQWNGRQRVQLQVLDAAAAEA